MRPKLSILVPSNVTVIGNTPPPAITPGPDLADLPSRQHALEGQGDLRRSLGSIARGGGVEVVAEREIEAQIPETQRADQPVLPRMVVGMGDQAWPAVGAVIENGPE